jgi:uncharacterized membrane protein YgcG
LWVQVPLQLGAAFTAAAQHSWKSPATQLAIRALQILQNTAQHAGIIHKGISRIQNNSMCGSIKQQLEHSGMREQLAAVMIALAAEMQAEAAALATGTDHTACIGVEQFAGANALQPRLTAVVRMHPHVVNLWLTQDFSPSADWLCNPSDGYAVAAMQLSTAALQHLSSLLQHVLPHVQECMPQKAPALQSLLRTNTYVAWSMCSPIFSGVALAQEEIWQQGQDNSRCLQQLLLSPHVLPCMASVVVLCAAQVSKTVAAGSDAISSSSVNSRKDPYSSSSSSSSTAPQLQRQQVVASANGSSSNSSSDMPLARRLQLLELLGLAPELLSFGRPSGVTSPLLRSVLQELRVAALACSACSAARGQHFARSVAGRGQQQAHMRGKEQQRQWEFESQVWLLLPTVLLPCASSLLSPNALEILQQDPMPSAPQSQGPMWQQQEEGMLLEAVQHLLALSNNAMQLLTQCSPVYQTNGRPVGLRTSAWVQEVLGAVLQLANQLLQQQPPASAEAATTVLHSLPTALPSASSGRSSGGGGGNSSSSGGDGSSSAALSDSSESEPKLACVELVLTLLVVCREYSHTIMAAALDGSSTSSGSGSSGGSSSGGGGSSSSSCETFAVSPVATRFVDFGAAFEASLRALTIAVQSGLGTAAQFSAKLSALCADNELLWRNGETHCALVQHMGLCGPVAFVKEQRQLYSLLSTVLKVGRGGGTAARLCLGQPATSSCCLAAGQAAVRLLTTATPVGTESATTADPQSLSAAAAATAQLSEVDYLPSLVIFGRCCVHWAQQLRQQAPELLLLTSRALEQQEQQRREAELHAHSAALVCIPALRSGVAKRPGDFLESIVATVSEWVGGIEAPAALAQLEAAGCEPQGMQKWLQALLLAVQGTQQGLTDASLNRVEQQLQGAGSMLCRIAVPHFCNNPACGNISGPTEVRLVSGRSCICAGCRTARYCGRDCQRAAWKQHKPVCKALAAAGIVGPAVATSSAVH